LTNRCHSLLIDNTCDCLHQRVNYRFAPAYSYHCPVVRGDLWRTLRDQHTNNNRFALDQRAPGSAKDSAKVILAYPFGQLGTELDQLFGELRCAHTTKPQLLLHLRPPFDPYLPCIVLQGLGWLWIFPC
jgi:hypothetical protein